MVSKNNVKLLDRKNVDKKQRFSLRKFSVGVASVLIGTTFVLTGQEASADANSAAPAQSDNTNESTSAQPLASQSQVTLQQNQSQSQPSAASQATNVTNSSATVNTTNTGTATNAGNDGAVNEQAVPARETAANPTVAAVALSASSADSAANLAASQSAAALVQQQLGSDVKVQSESAQTFSRTIHYEEVNTNKKLANDVTQSVTVVPYYKIGRVIIEYYDTDTNKMLQEDEHKAGYVGQKMDYNPKNTIASWENKGYRCISNNLPGFSYINSNPIWVKPGTTEKAPNVFFKVGTQTFRVNFNHGETPETPDTPGFHSSFVMLLTETADAPTDGTGTPTPTTFYAIVKDGQIIAQDLSASDKNSQLDFDSVTSPTIKNYVLCKPESESKILGIQNSLTDKSYYRELTVYYKHGTEPTTPVSISKTLVVHYQYASGAARTGKAADDRYPTPATVTFTRTGTKDLVTKNITWNDWNSNPQTFSDVTSPTIQGYTPNYSVISKVSVDPDSPETTERTVIYSPDTQKLDVTFVDDVTGKVLKFFSKEGSSDQDAKYSTTDDISNFKNQGYDLVSDKTNGAELYFDHNDKTDQHYTVHLTHGTTTTSRQNTVNETIHYVYADGRKAADDYIATPLKFVQTGTTDKVTQTTKWNNVASQMFAAHDSPTIDGYTPNPTTINAITVNYGDKDIVKTVTYSPDAQTLDITFIDVVTGKTLKTITKTGVSDQDADYNTNQDIKDYVDNYYVLISDSSKGDELKFDHDDSNIQHYVVHLGHSAVPQVQTKTTTRTIHYVLDDGSAMHDASGAAIPNVVQTVNYTGNSYLDEVTGQLANAKQVAPNSWVVDTSSTVTPSVKWSVTSGSQDKFAQVASPNVKGYVETPTVVEEETPTVPEGPSFNKDVYVVYAPVTYTTTRESKTVTRTINYLDSQTKQEIQNTPAVAQQAQLYRYQIKDEKGNVIGYGTLSDNGHTYQLSNDWHLDQNGWQAQTSPDLTSLGYKNNPHFADGGDASTVKADQPDLTNPANTTVNVYYDHDTVPVTYDKPGYGLTSQDLKQTVTREIDYLDDQGNQVNGSPEGTSSLKQEAKFTRTAIVDKVTKQLLGYDTNNDGKVDIQPGAGDYAWQPVNSQLSAVKSQDPSKVSGPNTPSYDSVNIAEVPAITVSYNTRLDKVRVIYSKAAQQGAFTVQYIDEDDNNAVLHADDITGKYGDAVRYTTSGEIAELEKSGYVLNPNGDGYIPQSTINDSNNKQIYKVIFHHGTKKGNVETLVPTETIHFQYSDGTQAAPDINGYAGDFKFTRTPILDAVDNHIIDPGTWNVASYQFKDGQNNVKVKAGYVASAATYGNKIATPTDLNVEDTIIYRPISHIVVVNKDGNPIPGTTPVDYVNDPNDPTKVLPNEDSPVVPNGWTISPNQPDGVTPNTTTNTAKVTPVDPTKPTEVVYNPIERGTVTVIFHDTTTNQDIPGYGPRTPLTGEKDSTVSGYDLNNDLKTLESLGYVRDTQAQVPAGDLTTMPTKYTNGTQIVYINLKHGTRPVTPDNPEDKPGLRESDLNKVIKRTINYQDDRGNSVNGSPDDTSSYVQTVKFTRTAIIDKVTGQIIGYDIDGDNQADVNLANADNAWHSADSTFEKVDSKNPASLGYTSVDISSVAAETVAYNTQDQIITVTYHKVVPTTYKNGTPETKTVTRTINYIDSTTDQPIPEELAKTVTQKVGFSRTPILDEKGNLVAYGTVSANGKSYTLQDWTPSGDWARVISPDLSQNGYTAPTMKIVEEVTPGVNTGDQTVTVYYGHQIIPVTPNDPKNGLTKEDLTKTVTETVKYTGAGNQTPADHVVHLTFNGEAYYDAVTKKWTDAAGHELAEQKNNITWTAVDGNKFSVVVTPMIDGYTANVQEGYDDGNHNVKEISGISQKSPNIVITVTYKQAAYTTGQPETKTVTRVINYVDSWTKQPIPEALVNTVTQNVKFTRTPIFDANGNLVAYGTVSKDGKSYTLQDWTPSGDWARVISPDLSGHGYTEPSQSDVAEVTPGVDTGDQTVTVYYGHQIIPVTPTHSGNHLDGKNLTKTVTETVKYTGAGAQTPADHVVHLTFNGEAYYDAVTNKWTDAAGHELADQTKNITWTNDGQQFATVVTPIINGYNPSVQTGYDDGNHNVKAIDGINHDSAPITILVTYTPVPINDQTAIVNYLDADENNRVITTSNNLSGKPGTKIDYSTADTIQKLKDQGYALVRDGFPAGAVYDNDDNTTQTYTVILKHTTTTITSDNPGTPGKPVDPNNPNGPKYPAGTGINNLKQTGHQTIRYVGAGDLTPADNQQSFDFTKTITFDNVTGKIISDSGWNVLSHTFGRVNTPVIQGYHADKNSAGETTITPTDLTKEITVNYAPNGKIIPIDQNGKPIPNASTPQYPTDPTDPTRVTPDEPVPTIPGWTPDQTTVTPKDPGKDTEVIYRVPTKDEGTVNVIVHDSTIGRNLPKYGWNSGTHEVGTAVDFNRTTTLNKLKDAGYKVINPWVAIPSEIVKGLTNVTIYVEHQIIPVTPDNPGNGLTKEELGKSVTETVHYEGAGAQTPSDVKKQLSFTGTAYYDAVTQKWTDAAGHELTDQTKNITWTANDGHSFGAVVTPKINGYEVTKVSPDYNDGNGNVKEIPGIDQNSRDINVTVTYALTPISDQNAIVKYIDADEGNIVITTSGKLTGKPGTKIDYSTANTIQDLVKKGYTLVNDGFPAGVAYDNDDNTTQTYTVVLKHTTTTVNPKNPGTPGQPIDPDNPGGPKYPTGTGINDLKQTGTQTVHYNGAGDQTPADNQQSFDFTKTITFDNVTGKIISDSGWNVTSHTFGRVDTPVVQGYHADKASAGEMTITPTDLTKTVTVTYAPNGKIIPVDPSGKPIPNTSTPQYPTDPTDPTKVTPDEPVPTVPGWTPDQTTVTPKKPGEDTKVIYRVPTKDEGIVNVIVHDSTTGRNLPKYGWNSGTHEVGTTVDFNLTTTLNELKDAGYKIVNPDVTIPGKIVKGLTNVVIYVEHQIIPVTPDNPGNGLTKEELGKTVTETVHYEGAGAQTPSDVKKQLDFTGTAYYDAVTKKWTDAAGHELPDQTKNITWTANDGHSFGAVVTPKIAGYEISVPKEYSDGNDNVKEISGINQDSANIDVTVTYKEVSYKNGQPETKTVTRTIHYIDSVTNQPIPDDLAQTVTQNVEFTRTPILDAKGNVIAYGKVSQDGKSYTLQGWTTSGNWARVISPDLTNSGYTNPSLRDVAEVVPGVDTANQVVNVYYGHQVIPVTPNNPGNGLNDQNLTKTVTETVHYTGAGDQTPADNVAQLNFSGTAYYDAVTKKWTDAAGHELADQTKNITWKADDGSKFAVVVTPVVKGYTSQVQPGYGDSNGDVKAIAGINQDSDDINVTVTYTLVPINDQTAIVRYLDADEQNAVIITSGNLAGQPGTKINYSTAKTIQDLESKGYVLVHDGFPANATYDHDDSFTQTYDVILKHTTTTVDPKNPGTPGQPVDPNNPDGPKYPTGTDINSLKKTGTQTIHYVGAGDQTPADNQQSFDFTKTITFDNVTGKIISDSGWNDSSHTFGRVGTPVVPGYHADKASAGETTITLTDLTKEVTVTYAPNGKIIPVDPNGKPIPNTSTPQYPTDPTDPTRVTPDEPVPTVPGWIPDQTTVTPKNPGKDTKVIYRVPAKDEGIINVIVHDSTTGQNLPKYGWNSGTHDVGTKVDFNKETTLNELKDAGYKVVNPEVTVPNEIVKGLTNVVIYVEHQIIPVTPDNPGNGLTKENLSKTVTETIHYVGAGAQTPSDVKNQLAFTGTAYYDAVTKKWTDAAGHELPDQTKNITWTANDGHEFAAVVTPKLDGYTASVPADYNDGDNNVKGISGINQNSADVNVTVTYTKVPVTPEEVQGQVQYIDDTTKQILATDTFSGKVGDKIVYTTDDKIKSYEGQGYELVSNDFHDGNETFAKSGNNFTVHLKHGTRPVTPNKPDPDHGYTKESLTKQGTQTVTYVGAGDQTPAPNVTNIEFDHTLVIDKVTGKVIADNGWTPTSQTYKVIDTPEVAGYTPDQQSAGGETVQIDPKTGNGDINRNYVVTYTKNPVPVNDQTAIVNYVDADENNALITSSGKLTGKPGTSINYSTAKTIKDLEGEGYVLVNDGFPAGATFDHDDSTTQTYTVVLKHAVIPVTPDKPGNGLQATDLTKTVTETVHYVGAGDQTPADKTAQLHFTGTAYYDSVTKKWTDSEGHELTDQSKNITWTAEDGHKFTVVETPAVDGYTSTVQEGYDDGNGNVKEISGIDQSSDDVSVTVTYNKKAEPTTPTNPNKPTEPETPTNPNKPTEPETPANPNNPVEPETPVNPDVPTNPEGPVGPMTPNNPGTPVNPAIPNGPKTPANPGTRMSLNTPVRPTVQPVANNTNHVISQPVSAQQQAPAANNNSTLPQTGNTEVVSAAALGLMGLAVVASLGAGATKKRHE